MSDSNGKFIWYELMTTDTQAAEAFYRDAIGWTGKEGGPPGKPYTILHAGEAPIGGLMTLPPEAAAMGARPGWLGYVAVDDIEASVAKITKAGGALRYGPEDIPHVGRFAVVTDPQGAAFEIIQGMSDQPASPPVAPGTPGHVGWHELYANDGVTAFAFYADQFGWTKADAMDMGPMGVYQMFATGADPCGGVMTKPAEVPQPFWQFYFNVDAVDAAVSRVQSGGGQILNGPMQVPGGSWIVQCMDPQGAAFAMVASKR
jgi:predicted enzyme related to lactoylglutathione lyase